MGSNNCRSPARGNPADERRCATGLVGAQLGRRNLLTEEKRMMFLAACCGRRKDLKNNHFGGTLALLDEYCLTVTQGSVIL